MSINQPDDGVFVPQDRYPFVMHFGGKKEKFDDVLAERATLDKADVQGLQKLAEKAKSAFPITGFWFIAAEKYLEAGGQEGVVPEGWKNAVVTLGEKPTPGFATNNLKMLVCRQRGIREIGRKFKDSGLPKKWAWFSKMSDEQRGKYQERLQMIGIVGGLEDLGPVVVTQKTSAARAMLGNSQQKDPGILNLIGGRDAQECVFYKYVLAPAVKVAKAENPKAKAIPQNWYWMELTHAKNEKGFPFYKKVEYGEGADDFVYITPVVWTPIEEAQKGGFQWTGWKNLLAPEPLIRASDAIRISTHEWAAAWAPENVARLAETIEDNETLEHNDSYADQAQAAANVGAYVSNPANQVQAPPPPEMPEAAWESLGSATAVAAVVTEDPF